MNFLIMLPILAFYLTLFVLMIVLMVKGIQALTVYTKKTKLEIQKLEEDRNSRGFMSTKDSVDEV